MTFEVKLIKEDKISDHLFRTVDYRIGSGPSGRLLPSWDNAISLPSKRPSWWMPLTEVYAHITLDELRQIDDDATAQSEFIKRSLTAAPGTNGLPILKLLLGPDDHVSDKDIEYLSHLLPPPTSAIGVTPLLYTYHITPTGVVRPDLACDQDRYLAFVKRFVQTMASGGVDELAIAVPPSVSHTGVGTLLETYKDVDTPLVVVDSNGQTNRERYPQLKALIGKGQKGTHNLTEKHDGSWALYGFDTKPFSGRDDVVPAVNLLQLDNGLSSFGRRRTVRMMIKRKRGAKPPPARPPRILYPKELSYARATVPDALSALKAWYTTEHGTTGSDSVVLAARRAYELDGMLHLGKLMADWSASGELEVQLTKRKGLAKDLRAIKRNNATILTPPLF
jgi:hypothetical protein